MILNLICWVLNPGTVHMNRITVIRNIIEKKRDVAFLEIGVAYGNVIFQVNASRKIGVEPYPLKGNFLGERIETNPISFYQQTSNAFFRRTACKILLDGADVIFVDGLHSYEQALRDVENMGYLKADGVIIMHDCNPLSFATAYPIRKSFDEALRLAKYGEIPGWNGCWNGDVWKALVHLRIAHNDLNIFTLDLDWGLDIITKSKSRVKKAKFCSLRTLKNFDYSLLEENRVKFLNLKHPKYLKEFISTL